MLLPTASSNISSSMMVDPAAIPAAIPARFVLLRFAQLFRVLQSCTGNSASNGEHKYVSDTWPTWRKDLNAAARATSRALLRLPVAASPAVSQLAHVLLHCQIDGN